MLKNFKEILTSSEKLAIDYFPSKGIDKKYQDLKIQPNVYDTRKNFQKAIITGILLIKTNFH